MYNGIGGSKNGSSSMVTKIQAEVAENAFSELEAKILQSPATPKAEEETGLPPRNASASSPTRRSSNNSGIAIKGIVARSNPSNPNPKLNKPPRNSNRNSTGSAPAETKANRYSSVDLEHMRKLANERAMNTLKQSRENLEKDWAIKEAAKLGRREAHIREKDSKARKRAEIYEINAVMREAFEKKYEAFAASMMLASDGHCVASAVDADIEGIELGGVIDDDKVGFGV